MKSIFKLSTLALIAISVLFTACNPDDDIIIDPGTDGIPVSDGFYMASTSADPTSSDELVAETVEENSTGFSSQDRTGFTANYIYAAGGSYNIVEIKDKEIVKTFGGTAETVTDMGSSCDQNDYTLVTIAEDGAAVTVAEGFYKVTFDQTTNELILIKIVNGGVIGSATPNGWGSDTEMTGTPTAAGFSFTAENVEMRTGEYKFRFNCRWNLSRRLENNDDWSAANGYQLFTNFGGSLSELQNGNDGSNIPISVDTEGIYTLTLDWTPADGWSASATKTDDVQPITFVPAEHEWGLIGSATPQGWDGQDDLNYEGVVDGTYSWIADSYAFVAGEFKFRQNDNWDQLNLGWNELTITGDAADLSDNGGNIAIAADGTYKVTLTTSDEGATYAVNFEKF